MFYAQVYVSPRRRRRIRRLRTALGLSAALVASSRMCSAVTRSNMHATAYRKHATRGVHHATCDGRAAPTPGPRLGLTLPRRHRDSAHPSTSAPGLGRAHAVLRSDAHVEFADHAHCSDEYACVRLTAQRRRSVGADEAGLGSIGEALLGLSLAQPHVLAIRYSYSTTST